MTTNKISHLDKICMTGRGLLQKLFFVKLCRKTAVTKQTKVPREYMYFQAKMSLAVWFQKEQELKVFSQCVRSIIRLVGHLGHVTEIPQTNFRNPFHGGFI